MDRVAMGSEVALAYILSLGDGHVVDYAERNAPASFQIGGGELAPALEAVLFGMCAKEEKSVQFEPDEVYGPHYPDRVLALPKTQFETMATLETGQVIRFQAPDEPEGVLGMILDIGEEVVSVDFNHPLAGRALLFEVTVLDIR